MAISRQAVFWIAAFATFFLLVYVLRGIMLPFVLGFAIAYMLDPVTAWLERWRMSRNWAVVVITAALILLFVAAVLLLIPVVRSQVTSLVDRLPEFIDHFRQRIEPMLRDTGTRLGLGDPQELRDAVRSYSTSAAKWLGGLVRDIVSGGAAIADLLSLLFITPLVAFYMLRDWDKIVTRLDRELPRDHAPVIREQIREIDKTIAAFARGQALVCLILGSFYVVALTLAGLDFALLIGAFSGLISFVPYVGSITGLVLSVGVALTQFDSLGMVGLVAGIFLFGQLVEGNFLTPNLVGDRVGLHPVWVVFALLAGGTLFGFVGVLLAVPLMAVVGVLARFALRRYHESRLYQGASHGGIGFQVSAPRSRETPDSNSDS